MKKIIFSELSSYLNSHSLIVRTNISSNECFSELKSLNIASNSDLTFFHNEKYINELSSTKAKAWNFSVLSKIKLPLSGKGEN